jgi:hypothetical protein
MLNKELAEKFLKSETKKSKVNTIREYFSHTLEVDNDDSSILYSMQNDIYDTVEEWASNNDLPCNDMIDFIMKHLDDKVNCIIEIDSNYVTDIKEWPISNSKYTECKFTGSIHIDSYFLDMGTWYNDKFI